MRKQIAIVILAAVLALPVAQSAEACIWPFVSSASQVKDAGKSKPLVEIYTPDRERTSLLKKYGPIVSIFGIIIKIAIIL